VDSRTRWRRRATTCSSSSTTRESHPRRGGCSSSDGRSDAGENAMTKAEAIRLARAHPTVSEALKSGAEVVVVEPEGGRGDGDRTVVGIHDHRRGRSLVALVAPTGVVGVHETPATFQLSDKERATAE